MAGRHMVEFAAEISLSRLDPSGCGAADPEPAAYLPRIVATLSRQLGFNPL